jgi:hypothetical protein
MSAPPALTVQGHRFIPRHCLHPIGLLPSPWMLLSKTDEVLSPMERIRTGCGYRLESNGCSRLGCEALVYSACRAGSGEASADQTRHRCARKTAPMVRAAMEHRAAPALLLIEGSAEVNENCDWLRDNLPRVRATDAGVQPVDSGRCRPCPERSVSDRAPATSVRWVHPRLPHEFRRRKMRSLRHSC